MNNYGMNLTEREVFSLNDKRLLAWIYHNKVHCEIDKYEFKKSNVFFLTKQSIMNYILYLKRMILKISNRLNKNLAFGLREHILAFLEFYYQSENLIILTTQRIQVYKEDNVNITVFKSNNQEQLIRLRVNCRYNKFGSIYDFFQNYSFYNDKISVKKRKRLSIEEFYPKMPYMYVRDFNLEMFQSLKSNIFNYLDDTVIQIQICFTNSANLKSNELSLINKTFDCDIGLCNYSYNQLIVFLEQKHDNINYTKHNNYLKITMRK